MKSFKNLLFENQDGIGILTMNRPAALNSLNQETVNELAELFGEVGLGPVALGAADLEAVDELAGHRRAIHQPHQAMP